MNWDAIGAVGEILGVAAVVISVVYLAAQVRNQTVESRLAATRELAEKRTDIMKLMATEDGMARLWLKAIYDYESLRGEDRMKASLLFHMAMRISEQDFIHIGTGHADDPYLESVDRVLSQNVAFRGIRQWWETTGDGFNQEFQDHVNVLIASTDERSPNSAFDVIEETEGAS